MRTSTDRQESKNMKGTGLKLMPAAILLLVLSFFACPWFVNAGQAGEPHGAALSGAAWHVEFALDQADRQKLIETASRADSGLAQKGISVNAAPGGVGSAHPVLAGTGTDRLRELLFGSVPARAAMPGGALTLKMAGQVTKDQLITLVLQASPSTGYSWSVARSDASRFEEQGPVVFEGSGGAIGGSRKQRIVLKALKSGSAVLHLVYRRPFDVDEKAVANITLDMSDIPETIDLSNPNKPSASVAPRAKTTGAPVGASSAGSRTAASDWVLFDWREHGGVTKVKDQKSCGSCWAFATVGALESLLKRTYSAEFDVSEQFLVSCNTDGWSCAAGGLFAHDYHLSADITTAKLGEFQSIYGAVLEKDMPYKAKDISCTAVAKHPVWMEGWTKIEGAAASLTVDEIKDIIFNYGPIAATVCAGGPAFHKYKSGVYNTDESAYCAENGGTDHMIVLVGWDNTTQTWILKNSWGTGWGEKGYMRIGWGISSVAQDISYVETPGRNCSYKVTPALRTIPYRGAALNVSVSASTLCPMPQATSDVTVTVMSQTWDGQKGTMKLVFVANDTSFSKSIGVSIGKPVEYPDGSTTLAVTQGYSPCRIKSVVGTSTGASSGTFTVTMDPGNPGDCEWTATGFPYDEWIHVENEGVVQTGTKTLSYTLDTNDTGRARTGKITATLGQNSKVSAITIKQSK